MLLSFEKKTRTEPTAQQILVTPEMAMKWLEKNHPKNRNVSEKRVQVMARDITKGRWMLTHAGIAFAPDGTLIDGQHRLWAIVVADIPVELFVWKDVDPKTMMVVDSGKSRSMTDVLHIAGKNKDINREQIAVLRAMLGGFSQPPLLSPSETSALLQDHSKVINFAIENLPHIAAASGVNTATTRAVIARAYYHVEANALEEFCRMLSTGVVTSEDESVIVMLRQQLIAIRGNSSAKRILRYGKIERTLLSWLRSENPSRIHPVASEIFPFPA